MCILTWTDIPRMSMFESILQVKPLTPQILNTQYSVTQNIWQKKTSPFPQYIGYRIVLWLSENEGRTKVWLRKRIAKGRYEGEQLEASGRVQIELCQQNILGHERRRNGGEQERKRRERERRGRGDREQACQEPRGHRAKIAALYRNHKLGKVREAQPLGWRGLG